MLSISLIILLHQSHEKESFMELQKKIKISLDYLIKGTKSFLRCKLLRDFVDTDICSNPSGNGIYEVPFAISTKMSLKSQDCNHAIISVLGKKDKLDNVICIVLGKSRTDFDFKSVSNAHVKI